MPISNLKKEEDIHDHQVSEFNNEYPGIQESDIVGLLQTSTVPEIESGMVDPV